MTYDDILSEVTELVINNCIELHRGREAFTKELTNFISKKMGESFAAGMEESSPALGPIDFDKLPSRVRSDLLDFCGENRYPWVRYAMMSDAEILDDYLVWNGIIGYSENIVAAVDGIRKART